MVMVAMGDPYCYQCTASPLTGKRLKSGCPVGEVALVASKIGAVSEVRILAVQLDRDALHTLFGQVWPFAGNLATTTAKILCPRECCQAQE